MARINNNDRFRIGIVSGKLGDVDGVSLEVEKWIKILKEMGHEIFTITGKYTNPLESVKKENQLILEKISFTSPEQKEIERLVFPHLKKNPPHLAEKERAAIEAKLEAEGKEVANILFEYIQNKNIDVIIAQNTNAMPMTLIGGMAVFKLATENRVATIFHHHDFWWERSRFSHNRIESLLSRIMPPADPGLEHIVLSTYAEHILRSLKRVQPKVIPNCEDFDNPVWLDEYNRDFRSDMGFRDNDILVVQPTRIVRRKRIEDSLQLIGKLKRKYKCLEDRIRFIISLYQGDEPDIEYVDEIKKLAEHEGIPLYMISGRVSSIRKIDDRGRKIYTNRDILANADIVTYLPRWEGFGNALLETIAAKVPLVTTTYLVYKTDIKIMGFKNIEIRDIYDEEERLAIPERVLDEMYYIITHHREKERIVNRNFRIAKKEFGIKTLRDKIAYVLKDYSEEIKASRKRIKKSKRLYSV
ncbi:MAG: glycosyl transferase family 1 [Spirochaetes bacterium]|nr:MAG: glycosyl transferase family 1 [Spirochaetota bacterium]